MISAAGMLAGSGKGVSRDRGLNSQTSDSCATGVADLAATQILSFNHHPPQATGQRGKNNSASFMQAYMHDCIKLILVFKGLSLGCHCHDSNSHSGV